MLRKCRLMLVDDDASIRRVLREYFALAPGDFEVVAEAVDGFDAVEKAASVKPDVILMDVRMPRMDGIEATRRIKRELGLGAAVVTVTSCDWAEIQEEARAAGSEFYVRKPFDLARVAEAIEEARAAARRLTTAAYG